MSSRSRSIGAAIAAALALFQGGCGGATVTPTPHARRPVGDLLALVPDGAITIVVIRPADLWGVVAVREVADELFPEPVRTAFAQRTGVDPVEVREVVVAEYDQSLLWLARGPFDADLVVREAGSRMATVESESDHPYVRRAGFIGNDRQELAALDRDVVAVTGLPDVMARVLARAAGRSGAGPRALEGRELTELVRAHHAAPLVVYAPRPLSPPAGLGASQLLLGERALAASVVPHGDTLDVTVDLIGELLNGTDENFRTWVRSIASSDLGGAFGLGSGVDSLRVTASTSAVRLEMPLDASNVLTGVRVLFTAELRELLEAPR